MSKFYLLIGSLLSLGIPILILLCSNSFLNKFKSLFILFVINIFIIVYINKLDRNSSFKEEFEMIKSIQTGNLSLSYLTGVTIFILGTLTTIKASLYFVYTVNFNNHH
ncbi:hypothetical protein CPAV1605_224 [seawater metagenome]|uniref:Uncharacterized protein n=1 Tax=seawater metagenome TaxID=1561972 RepID=A0A5E8CLB7_9ZZZZ